jgi:hypothetical protein
MKPTSADAAGVLTAPSPSFRLQASLRNVRKRLTFDFGQVSVVKAQKYTCGGFFHAGRLFLPWVNKTASNFISCLVK